MDIPPSIKETLIFLTWFFRSSHIWRTGRQLVRDHGIDPDQCVVSILAGEDISENPNGAVCALFVRDGRRLCFDFSCDQQTGDCQAITRIAEDWGMLNPHDQAANWLAQSPEFDEFNRLVRARVAELA